MYLFNFAKKIIAEREFQSLLNELRLKIKTLKWNKKYKAFNVHYVNRQWEQAIEVANKTVQAGQADQEFYQKLANSYVKTNNQDEAKRHMKKALQLRVRTSKKEVVNRIETSIFTNRFPLESQFTYLGGSDNLGFVKHIKEETTGRKKYLTKIVPTDYPLDHFANKERYFNNEIRQQSPDLKEITPEMINDAKLKNEHLLFMTFPLLANDGISRANFKDLIEINEKIASAIDYHQIVNLLKATDKGKAHELSALMHRRSTHQIIFRYIKNKISDLPYREELKQQVARFERIILEQALYEKITPTADYVFCHGDFNANNILYNQQEHRYYVIDWSSYGLGLRGYDLAKFFASYRVPFSEIEKDYLDSIFAGGEAAYLQKIFFVYNLFIFWINRLDLDNIEEQLTQCIVPGVNYVEKLMRQQGHDV